MSAAIWAAGSYCIVESKAPTDLVVPAVDCCIEIESNDISELSDKQDIKKYCALLQSYNHWFFDSLLELESLVPVEKQNKNLLAVPPFFNIHFYADNIENTISHISLDVLLPYFTPPIFLLTSTFLN